MELHEEEVISEAHENIDIQNSCLQLSNPENSSDEAGGKYFDAGIRGNSILAAIKLIFPIPIFNPIF